MACSLKSHHLWYFHMADMYPVLQKCLVKGWSRARGGRRQYARFEQHFAENLLTRNFATQSVISSIIWRGFCAYYTPFPRQKLDIFLPNLVTQFVLLWIEQALLSLLAHCGCRRRPVCLLHGTRGREQTVVGIGCVALSLTGCYFSLWLKPFWTHLSSETPIERLQDLASWQLSICHCHGSKFTVYAHKLNLESWLSNQPLCQSHDPSCKPRHTCMLFEQRQYWRPRPPKHARTRPIFHSYDDVSLPPPHRSPPIRHPKATCPIM